MRFLVVPAKAGTHNHRPSLLSELWLQPHTIFNIGGYGSRIALGFASLVRDDAESFWYGVFEHSVSRM